MSRIDDGHGYVSGESRVAHDYDEHDDDDNGDNDGDNVYTAYDM